MAASIARSTISLVLKELHTQLKTSIDPNLPIVYNQDLQVVGSVGSDRSDRAASIRTGKIGSLLAYRRTVLKPREDNLRNRGRSGKDVGLEGVLSFNGEFDFEFTYFTQDVRQMESFEILYACMQKGTDVQSVSVDLGTLGLFTYQVVWEPLDSLEIGLADTFNQALTGKATVAGMFLAVTTPVSGIINTIDTTVKMLTGYDLEVFSNPRVSVVP